MSKLSANNILEPCQVDSFRYLKGPIIDLRTPKEFSQGHWPGATNIPLFNNEERAAIGKSYKQDGQHRAIILGLGIVSPKLSRLIKSLKEIKQKQESEDLNDSVNYLKLYCWRGGMRSASVAWLSYILDLKPVLLLGGYKAYRNWVLNQFTKEWPLKLIGGKTGTGKTDLLLSLEKKGVSIIDLEGLANHRGSSFGSLGLPSQPSTEQYENNIGETLEIFAKNKSKEIFVEAESANLGHCRIPFEFFRQMRASKMIEVNRSIEERINQLVGVYGCQDKKMLIAATLRITKRLGPQRTAKALKAIEEKNWGEACFEILDYYDRYYEKDLSKIKNKKSIDISGLTPEEAATKLFLEGHINKPASPQH